MDGDMTSCKCTLTLARLRWKDWRPRRRPPPRRLIAVAAISGVPRECGPAVNACAVQAAAAMRNPFRRPMFFEDDLDEKIVTVV